MNRRRFMIVVTLAAALLMGQGEAAFGTSETAEGPYVYQYQGDAVEMSDHYFTFQWMYGDTPWENVRNRHHGARIFSLENLENGQTEAAYCADFIVSAVNGSKYRRMNLEDSTYYSEAAAAHIRGVVEKGFRADWTDEDLKQAQLDANVWLASCGEGDIPTDVNLPGDADDPVEAIMDLSRGEALLATQLAIWAFANTEDDGFWVKYYKSLTTDEEGVYSFEELPNDVKAFRKYLIHQQAVAQQRQDIVFTDKYFVTDWVAYGEEEDRTYDVTLKVQLAGDIDARDKLQLSAQVAGRQPQVMELTEPEDGWHTIRLEKVTPEEAEAGVTLEISGSQYVDGVYFYEAEPAGETARDTSQNLVGHAEGLSPVEASAWIPLDPENMDPPPEEDPQEPEKEDPKEEEKPVASGKTQTGDGPGPWLFVGAMVASAIAMMWTAVRFRWN